MKRVSIVAALASLALVVPAEATTKSVSDPNDADGKLDIATVVHGHGRTNNILQHRIKMRETWKSRVLSNYRSSIEVWFSTDDEDRFGEQRAIIEYQNERLTACLQIYEEEGDAATVGPCKEIRVWRGGPRRVVIAFDKSLLEVKSAYKWSVTTFFFRSSSTNCSSNECEDSAPRNRGRGQIIHRI